MPTLKTTLELLAAEFAANVLAAIKTASLEEIMREGGGAGLARGGRRAVSSAHASSGAAPSATASSTRGAKRGGRLARRSPEAIAKVKADIVQLLAKSPKGLRSEEIRRKLGISKQEIPRPLADALSEKLITKKGEKRATTYFKK